MSIIIGIVAGQLLHIIAMRAWRKRFGRRSATDLAYEWRQRCR